MLCDQGEDLRFPRICLSDSFGVCDRPIPPTSPPVRLRALYRLGPFIHSLRLIVYASVVVIRFTIKFLDFLRVILQDAVDMKSSDSILSLADMFSKQLNLVTGLCDNASTFIAL